MNVKKLYLKHHLITATCVSLLIFGVVLYMYFLSLSVVHVVMRKEVIQQVGQLRSEIAFLETEYIEANHVISTRVATLDGFRAIEEKTFIKEATSLNLVLRTIGE